CTAPGPAARRALPRADRDRRVPGLPGHRAQRSQPRRRSQALRLRAVRRDVEATDMSDARLSTTFPAHPKTKKLQRRLGDAGPLACIYLFLWASQNRSDGDLRGMSDEDIELAIDWRGEPDAFVRAMVDVGYLDGDRYERRIHDWHDHNPWAAGAEMRSAKARWNAVKRHHGVREADRQVPEYAAIRANSTGSDATSNATSNATS